MCIIVSKEKGVKLPKKQVFKTCFENNDDGCGFMYVNNGKVVIEKGFMTFDSFYKRLKKVKKELKSDLTDKSMVFHFRIGTQGGNIKENTHPFAISSKVEDLKATKIETDLGMVHNGVLSKYDYDKTLSDTQLFVRDFVSNLKGMNKNFLSNVYANNLIEKEARYNKLAFLDKNENITYFGDFIENEGIKYSNGTYENYRTAYTYNNNYKWSSDYDWEDYERQDYVETTFNENMEKLEEGDIIYALNYDIIVGKNDQFYIDNEGFLYEYFDGKYSLIETNIYEIVKKNFEPKQFKNTKELMQWYKDFI